MKVEKSLQNPLLMQQIGALQGVWFVYDGACPVCTQAALALRIKEQFGQLHLLDARTASEHVLMQAINLQGLDLDEGMVIYHDQKFYSGQSALQFMSRYGAARGWFNLANKALFWSKGLARLMYPWMRGIRNWLIRGKNIERIDNLRLQEEPIFKSVFGHDWQHLPPALQKHYAIRPYTDDVVILKGHLDIRCSWPIKVMAPLFWLIRSIPTKNAEAVPVTVRFESHLNTQAFHFKRQFFFKKNKPYRFKSALFKLQDNEVIEVMGMGVCWRSYYCWEKGRIKMIHKGYVLKMFGHLIPLPVTWLLGKGYGEEWAVSDDAYAMRIHMQHQWWGKIYQYKGEFTFESAI